MAQNPFKDNIFKLDGENPFAENPYKKTNIADEIKKDLGPELPKTEDEIALNRIKSQKENLETRLVASGVNPEAISQSTAPVDDRNIIGRALNLNTDQGFLMDFFEVIDRPGQMIKGLFDDGMEGAIAGLTGKREITGEEFAKDVLGFDTTDFGTVGGFAASLAVDIFTDPLTYLPAGFFLKNFKKLGNIGSKVTKGTASIIGAQADNVAKKIVKEGKKGVDFFEKSEFLRTVFDPANARRAKNKGLYEKYLQGNMTLAQVNKEMGKGGLGEFLLQENYFDEMSDVMDNLLDDFIKATGRSDNPFYFISEGTQTVAGKQAKKATDFSIFYDLGDGTVARISKIEAKTLIDFSDGALTKTSAAYGNKLAMRIDETLDDLVSKGYDANTLGEIFSTLKESVGEKKFGDFVNNLLTNKYSKTSKSESLRNIITDDKKYKAFIQGVEELFFGKLANDGVSHVMFFAPTKAGGKGKPILMSVENARKLFQGDDAVLKFTASFGFSSPTSALSGAGYKTISRELIQRGIVPDETYLSKVMKTTSKGRQRLSKIRARKNKVLDDLFATKKGRKGLSNANKIQIDDYYKISNIEVDPTNPNYYILSSTKLTSPSFTSHIDLAKKGAFIPEDANELGQFVAGLFETVETTTQAAPKRISLLTRLTESDTMFQRPAEIVKAALDSVEVLRFKLKFGRKLSPEMKSILSRIQGEQAYRLNQLSRRAVDILDDMSTQGPEAYKFVMEILESGASIDPKGVISYAARRYTVGDTLQYVLDDFKDGIPTYLPDFESVAARTAYKGQLNNYVDLITGQKDMFDIVSRNGVEVLEFKGSYTELEDIFQQLINSPAQAAAELSFGQKRLSSAAEDFFRQNGAQIDQLRGLEDDIFDIYINELGYKNLDEAMKREIGFKRHMLSKQGKQYLNKMSPITRKGYLKSKTSGLANRRFMGTSEEINRGLREYLDLDFDFFETDITKTVEAMIGASMSKVGQTRTLKEMLGQIDTDGDVLFKTVVDQKQALDVLGPKYVALEDSFEDTFKGIMSGAPDELKDELAKYFGTIGLEKGKTIAMHRSAIEALQRLDNAFIEIPQYLKGMDKFLNFFKGVTLLNPGYHMRNFFGNMTNSYLVGMNIADQARYLARAGVDISQYEKLSQKIVDGIALTAKENETYKRLLRFFQSGAAQRHRATRDLDTLIKAIDDAGAQGTTLRQQYRQLVKANFNLAEGMDDLQRYALFSWALESPRAKKVASKMAKNGDPQKLIDKAIESEALNIVSESLFDYSALTSFEQHVMKRLFPFYTFFRKNLEFQMVNVLKNPQQYARLGRAYEAYNEQIAGISTEDMPDYMQGNMWIPFPVSFEDVDGEERRMYFRTNLPPSEVGEVLEGGLNRPVASMNSFLKLPFELAVNRDVFTGAPLSEFRGEDNRKGEDNGGLLPTLRTERGDFALTGNPVVQKIANDLGLRVPRNYTSLVLDILDGVTGARPGADVYASLGTRLGIATTTPEYNREMTMLYQQLERLRQLQDLYEQEVGRDLPTLAELGR